MPVPEATMGENYGLPSRQHDIRFSGQLADMNAESEAESMQASAENKFWPGVRSPNAGHHPTADFGSDDISHTLPWLAALRRRRRRRRFRCEAS